MIKILKKMGLLLGFLLSLGAGEKSFPWFTGPLIAPPGQVVPYGHFLVKSYLFAEVDIGQYNNHWKPVPLEQNLYRLSVQEFSFLGLTPWCDLNLVPRVFYNFSSGEQSVHFGDLTVGLDLQLLAIDQTPYFPGIKLAIREVFPTGNFEYLRPRKALTDSTGAGTFATQFDLVLYKLFHLYNLHWLSLTCSAEYTVNTPVSVHGFNTYGGGFNTRGTVLPGNRFKTLLSFELSLNQNWALALDNVYTYTEATQFYGSEGITFEGTLATVGSPSSKQLSFAPSIECNLSPHFGMIGGCYFSALGKNSPEFRSAILNFNYFY